MSNSSIWLIDRNISDATTLGPSGFRSYGNEWLLRISQSSIISGASPSDCLVSYTGHSLVEGYYPSAEMQSVYSTAPANWAMQRLFKNCDRVLTSSRLNKIKELRLTWMNVWIPFYFFFIFLFLISTVLSQIWPTQDACATFGTFHD